MTDVAKAVLESLRKFKGGDEDTQAVTAQLEPWPCLPTVKGDRPFVMGLPKQRITNALGDWRILLDWIATHPDNADLKVAGFGLRDLPEDWFSEMPPGATIIEAVQRIGEVSATGEYNLFCVDLDTLTCLEEFTPEMLWEKLTPVLVHFLRNNDLTCLVVGSEENTPRVFRFYATRRWMLTQQEENVHVRVLKDKIDATTGYDFLISNQGEPW